MSTSISKLESKSGWKETGLQTADISSMFTWIAIKASPICYLALVTSDSYQLPVNSLINIQTHAEIILSDFLCSLNTLYVRPLQVLTVTAFAISSKGNITFFFLSSTLIFPILFFPWHLKYIRLITGMEKLATHSGSGVLKFTVTLKKKILMC